MEEKQKITVEFSHTNEFGHQFSMRTSAETYPDLGETDLDFFGTQFNIFLKQCGYVRKNDHIFMEDVTDEELCALEDFLNDLRSNDKSGGDGGD